MDVLLIEAPLSQVSEKKVDMPPLGLAYIAAILRQKGFNVRILDMNISDSPEKYIEDADIIGISSYTQNYPLTVEIMKKAKDMGKTVAAGGVHATFRFKEALNHGFDFVVRGEGEYSLSAAVEKIGRGEEIAGQKGIAVVRDGTIVDGGFWRVRDINALPLPARELLELDRYSFPGAISTSRGCAYACVFCSSRAMSGHLRMRTPESVFAEVKEIKNLGYNSFFIIDPNFAFDKNRALKICSLVKPLDMVWFSELRLDHIDSELIRAMAEAGCRVVRFGIESGSQEVINTIKKGIQVNRVIGIIKEFVRSGITPVCGFMLGNPGESKDSVEATLRLAEEIKAAGGEAAFSVHTPYPDTPVFRHPESYGIAIHSCNWWEFHHLNPVISTEHFSIEELRALLFDAVLRVERVSLPEIEIDESYPEIYETDIRLERKSFRSIALEKVK